MFSRPDLLTLVFPEAENPVAVDTYVHYLRRKLGRERRRHHPRAWLPARHGAERCPGLRAESVLVRRAARRLGMQAAAFVAVAVVLVTAAAVAVLLRDQERAVTKLLDATVALADDVGDPPLDTWLVIRDARGQNATGGLPAGADDPAAFAAVVAGGRRRRPSTGSAGSPTAP